MNSLEAFPWETKYFDENLHGTDYVVGDIHGEFSRLEKALSRIGFNRTTDRLFCLGDLIDRGPESERFIDFLSCPWFFSIVGNHEAMLLNYGSDSARASYTWYPNGGWWWENTDETFRQRARSAVSHSMSSTITVQASGRRIGLVHANVPSGIGWDRFCKDLGGNRDYQMTGLWSRSRILSRIEETVEGVDYIFCGHTPLVEPAQLGNVVFIDTGSGHRPSSFIPNPRLTIYSLTGKAGPGIA